MNIITVEINIAKNVYLPATACISLNRASVVSKSL